MRDGGRAVGKSLRFLSCNTGEREMVRNRERESEFARKLNSKQTVSAL